MATSNDRRTVLKSLSLALAGAGLGQACAVKKGIVGSGSQHPVRLTAVEPSWDRVIRTVAGLRPFRPSGFVLRAERLGTKTLIHNYGHGGGGVTLSWGTGMMAVEEALRAGEKSCAVLGCGAVGLATAWLLLRRGFAVTIYAKDLPPATTSSVAGAQWTPSWVTEHGAATPEFETQLVRAARLSYRFFQTLVGERYGVRWIDNYEMSDHPIPDVGYRATASPIRDLYPDLTMVEGNENPFTFPFVRRFPTMLIEPPVYLDTLMRDVVLFGGKIEVREFASPGDVDSLPEPIVVNCTGLGARALFGDEELIPMKGQLVVQLPQPGVDYIALHHDAYMFPRSDGIVLGGTYERGEWSVEPTADGNRKILAGCEEIFSRLVR
jgi:hypothetical protein